MESSATKVWFGQSKRATLFEGTCFNFLLLIFCVFFRNSFPKLCGKVTCHDKEKIMVMVIIMAIVMVIVIKLDRCP